MRLRFLRSGESFGIICSSDQVSKMERVIEHNGGRGETVETTSDALFIRVIKV